MNAEHSDDASSMLLIFKLEGEFFGVSVQSVHEILDPQDPTPVPNADPFAPGLINVRGVVVPVIDVRRRLRMGQAADLETARMIVLEHLIDGAATKIAFSADAVETVIEADLSALERVPDLGASWPQVYLRGAVRRDGELLVLLDTDALFAPAPSPQAA
ncbi:MAG: chemotaxis protein CheW [Rhodobacteraceae bacterium]|nr:chemotaxis protein CheW [Paracoccaceae bacterium]QEW21853.1 Coupling protein CheW [Marinibacterium anthonyi]|tara:strand:+ start:55 stop:531 length:477 start_codon:yes stop_codon:yes gene_type:complete